MVLIASTTDGFDERLGLLETFYNVFCIGLIDHQAV